MSGMGGKIGRMQTCGQLEFSDRHPREPLYIASSSGPSVFDNDPAIDTVPLPVGGYLVEGMPALGGAIASAPAMIRFANRFQRKYQDLVSCLVVGESFGWRPGGEAFRLDR